MILPYSPYILWCVLIFEMQNYNKADEQTCKNMTPSLCLSGTGNDGHCWPRCKVSDTVLVNRIMRFQFQTLLLYLNSRYCLTTYNVLCYLTDFQWYIAIVECRLLNDQTGSCCKTPKCLIDNVTGKRCCLVCTTVIPHRSGRVGCGCST